MDFWIDLGITAVLRLLRSKKEIKQWADALAKVFVKIEVVAELEPTLKQAIHAQRQKQGLA